jgi:hypothetical protein
MSLTLN